MKSTLYALVFIQYVCTVLYVLRHTTTFGKVLLLLLCVTVSILCYIVLNNLVDEDSNEDK